MNLSFKPWGIAVLCGAAAFALASVMFMQGWLPVSSRAETTTQPPPSAPATPVPVPATTSLPLAFTQAQLDQWVAPVALYPDSLLSQVLMASTYPTNVIQAAQWSRDHPQSQGDAAVSAVVHEPWDPSVKSLVAFPQLLALMGEDPAWVQNLGDAFLAQPADVMDTVQKFRLVAQKSGALKSTPQQKVTVKPAVQSSGTGSTTTVVNSAPAQQTIIIESADPQVVYVPNYNPNVVYGAWPTPAYPPVYLPPPPGEQFVNGVASGIGFGVGVAATYAIFGSIDWDDDHHHDDDHHDDHHDDGHHDDGHHGGPQNNYVNVNVNNYNRISGNNNSAVNHAGSVNTAGWQHNAAFNTGTPTRSANLGGATQNRALNNAALRNNYRGFDGNAVGRNDGGVQNQNLAQRRQQAASVMNNHPGFTPEPAHSSPGQVPASRPASASDKLPLAGHPSLQHDQLSHQGQMPQHQYPLQKVHQGGNVTGSTAFSGNSSRAPSWQQQQARGDQSRHQIHQSLPARSAGAETHHFQRR